MDQGYHDDNRMRGIGAASSTFLKRYHRQDRATTTTCSTVRASTSRSTTSSSSSKSKSNLQRQSGNVKSTSRQRKTANVGVSTVFQDNIHIARMPLTTVSNPKYTVDTRSVYSIQQPREEMEVIYDDYELSGVKMERIDHSDMNNNDPLSSSLTTSSSSSSSLQSAHTNRRSSLSSSSELKNSKELEKLGNRTRVQLLECRMKRLEEKRQEVLSKDTELKRKFAELKAKRQALNEIRTPENERPKSRLNRDAGSGEKRRSWDRQSPYDRGSSRKRGLGRKALIEVQSPSERGYHAQG